MPDKVIFKTVLRGLAALSLVAFLPTAAVAAVGAGQADALVLTPLVISEEQELSFGSLEVGATEGTVNISTSGVRTPTGGVSLGPTIGAQAQFDITGSVSESISIGTISGINITSAGDVMPVVFDTSGAPTSLDASGKATLNVGATLTVPSGQPAGAYSGSFTVTVSYN